MATNQFRAVDTEKGPVTAGPDHEQLNSGKPDRKTLLRICTVPSVKEMPSTSTAYVFYREEEISKQN
jgi:hypothetical protein